MTTVYSTQTLGHLGIVAGVCEQIGLIEQIDVEHVDIEHEAIHLQTRGGKPNILLIDEKAMTYIAKWLRTRSLFKMDTKAVFISMHWVSGRGEPGKRLSRRGIRLIVDGYLKDLEIKELGISCKNLRQLAMQSPKQNLEHILSIPHR
jgi:site-specific recombinase XerC